MDHNKSNNQLLSLVSQIDTTLDPYFTKKAPQLPANIQELIAKIAPYLTVIGVIVGVLGMFALSASLLFLLGITGMVDSPYYYGGYVAAQSTGFAVVGLVIAVVQLILEAMAIPGLFKYQRKAWNLLYAASLVGLITNLISMNVIGLVINFLISFYLLYQIKALYNK